MKGVLLDTTYDLVVRPKLDSKGKILTGMVPGNTTDQEAAMVLQMSQGELKEDPLIGVGLTKFMRGKYSATKVEQRIRSHFTRAGIDYDEYKERMEINIKTDGL